MSNANTGGPAFPHTERHDDYNGMTLRDYFAAKAMQGYVSHDKAYDFDDMAALSYRMADAMLKARGA